MAAMMTLRAAMSIKPCAQSGGSVGNKTSAHYKQLPLAQYSIHPMVCLLEKLTIRTLQPLSIEKCVTWSQVIIIMARAIKE